MGYTDRKDAGINPKGRLILTAGHLKDYLKQIESEHKFYELEMAEVVEVHLDETKSSFPKRANGKPNYAYYGGILARYIVSEKGKPVDYLTDCKPLNPNIMTYPIVGELVYIAQISEDTKGSKFYFSPFNFYGSPSHNLKPNLSIIDVEDKRDVYVQFVEDEKHKEVVNTGEEKFKTGYYHEVKNYPRLMAEEGDVVVEGRFGNTIRIGSDIKNENADSPNIILNAGQSKDDFPNPKQPVEERIDTDGSSVYITTNQPLTFTPGLESKLSPPPYEGKNILLSSDRLIFNTKNGGDIVMGSNNNIAIGAVTEVVIEAPTTKIGSVDATEPLVLGDILESKLNDILTLIETGLLAPTGPVVVGPGAGLLANIKSTLSKIKSPNNKVE